MVEAEVILGLGAVVATVGAAMAYAHFTGEEVSASVDTDNDGEDDVSVSFGENEFPDPEPGNIEAADGKTESPTPDEVLGTEGLEDIKGIGPVRAQDLVEAGFKTPEDIYYASDENLNDVNGIGPRAVSHMREDIGGVDYDADEDDGGNGGESTAEPEDNSSESTGQDLTNEQSSSNETDESTSEDDAGSDETDGSDSQDQTDGSGNESDDEFADDHGMYRKP